MEFWLNLLLGLFNLLPIFPLDGGQITFHLLRWCRLSLAMTRRLTLVAAIGTAVMGIWWLYGGGENDALPLRSLVYHLLLMGLLLRFCFCPFEERMKRILSGARATGQLHLGNYCGMIRQLIELQQDHELFIFVASYHALTTHHDAAALQASCRQVAIDYLAFGIDPERASIYQQHHLPEVTELQWLLACVCPLHLSDKGVTYKDMKEKDLKPNFGVYGYPVLQAADILIVDADIVPVGRDQIQNIEICRDLAGRFNHIFGNEDQKVFKLPEYRVPEHAAVLPGTDGQKMSKSYNNIIDPFMAEKKAAQNNYVDQNGLDSDGRSERSRSVSCVQNFPCDRWS